MQPESTATYASGPWEAYNGHDGKLGSWVILAPAAVRGGASQVVFRTSDDTPLDAANAHLGAAAPTMLAALEGIQRMLTTMAQFTPTLAVAALRSIYAGEIAEVEEAIKKATR